MIQRIKGSSRSQELLSTWVIYLFSFYSRILLLKIFLQKAPEILQNKLHGPSVDWWCFGVAMFLLLCQEPPFWHENHKELFEEIKTKEPYWEDHAYLSPDALSLLKALLLKNPDERLGSQGVSQLKQHPFFKPVDWDKVLEKGYKPPFVPTIQKRHSISIPVTISFFKITYLFSYKSLFSERRTARHVHRCGKKRS